MHAPLPRPPGDGTSRLTERKRRRQQRPTTTTAPTPAPPRPAATATSNSARNCADKGPGEQQRRHLYPRPQSSSALPGTASSTTRAAAPSSATTAWQQRPGQKACLATASSTSAATVDRGLGEAWGDDAQPGRRRRPQPASARSRRRQRRLSSREQCDDGHPTTIRTTAAPTSCRFPACGDGFTQPSLGEECDTSNGQQRQRHVHPRLQAGRVRRRPPVARRVEQ